MIEERNLFEGRVTNDERNALLTELDILISEKENMLYRCEKISVAVTKLYTCPMCQGQILFKKSGDTVLDAQGQLTP